MTRSFVRPTAISVGAVALLVVASAPLVAQSLDDGMTIPRRTLSAGVLYSHDSWTQYWEGTLKRSNANIGTLTTQSATAMVGYGVADRLGVTFAVPYVWTRASQGTLKGLSGVQDLTVAAKFRLLTTSSADLGSLNAFITGTGAVPVGNYTPDLVPLSIGSSGRRASARLTLAVQPRAPLYFNASAAYTFCSNVTLDRTAYYTDGQLFLTNQVAMPNVREYTLGAGYRRGRLQIPVSLVQQRTLGGGDIRRQDMPFVSNRMDFLKAEGAIMYDLPKGLSLRVGGAHVLNGRNVGQSTTFTTGVFNAIHF
jgi:hypothetical protein